MRSLLLILSALFILSACAGSSTPKVKQSSIDWDNVATPEGEKLYCKKEYKTGTHIKTMTCLTKAEMDDARETSTGFVGRIKGTAQPGSSGN